MAQPELKPCPFCGNDILAIRYDDYNEQDGEQDVMTHCHYEVTCTDCNATISNDWLDFKDKEQAYRHIIQAWNTREEQKG